MLLDGLPTTEQAFITYTLLLGNWTTLVKGVKPGYRTFHLGCWDHKEDIIQHAMAVKLD